MAQSCDKYPKHYKYLPTGFQENGSHNKSITDRYVELHTNGDKAGFFHFINGQAVVREEFTGLNKSNRRIEKSIGWGEFYFLNAIGTNIFKFGITENFIRRFREISAASPLPIQVIYYCKCDNPHLLESHLMKMYGDRNLKNEWFALKWEQAQEVIDFVDKYFEK